MKRLLALALCAAMCLTGAACSETVGKTGMYNENSILRCVAPNGQELYYLGQWVAERVEPRLEDVNFDGMDDVVVMTARGATNGWEQYFVWNGESYEHAAWNWGCDTGLPNAVLHADGKLLETCETDGWAGLLHRKAIYRWEGTELVMIRCAVSEETEDGQGVRLRVYEAEYGEGERVDRVVWERSATLEECSDGTVLDEENATLWDGLK